MRRIGLGVLVSFFIATSIIAQNNRTAVSISGSDAAACTVPDPCRTFAVALSKTNANGEVVALTSGGYGPFIIDRAATIVAAPGIYAALVAASGADAIHVNAGAAARVVIRGLHLYGLGTGNAGISVTESSGEVNVENCVIDGFLGFGGAVGYGIIASLNVRVSDTTIRHCGGGIKIENVSPTFVRATINRVEVKDIAPNHGIWAGTNANVTVRDSVVSNCSSGSGFVANSGQLNIENSLATDNSQFGVDAENNGTVRVSNTMATHNGTGFGNFATFISWGNNKVQGNSTNTTGTITLVSQD